MIKCVGCDKKLNTIWPNSYCYDCGGKIELANILNSSFDLTYK